MDCQHEFFYGHVVVKRLTDEDDSNKVTGYMADITVRCHQCGCPFEFIGVPGGSSFGRPMVNFDATELRAPIKPSSDPVEAMKVILK